MKIKNSLILCALTLTGLIQHANASDSILGNDAHRLIQEMVSTISKSADAKSAQAAICKEGGVFRRSSKVKGNILPVVAYNCESYDFFNYALLMCADYPGFSSSTCYKKGTEVFKKRGETPSVEGAKKYIAQSIKDKKVDPYTLSCSTPRAKLMSELKNVADVACNPTTPPTAKPQTGWQTATKPSATGSKIVIGNHRLNPPVVITQSALRDLPARDSSLVSDLVQMQSSITDVIKNSAKAPMIKQEALLVDQYEKVNSTLGHIKIEVEANKKKNLTGSLLAEAQKLSDATKAMIAAINSAAAA